jgi:hypothetical protein
LRHDLIPLGESSLCRYDALRDDASRTVECCELVLCMRHAETLGTIGGNNLGPVFP